MGVVHKRLGSEDEFGWEGVDREPYAGSDVEGGCRQVLIGPQDGARNFAVRYFELPAGGGSTLEHHVHDHGVMILRGRGRVLLGDDAFELGPGDVVYVEQNERHRFENTGQEPLGFLCVIPTKAWLDTVEALRAAGELDAPPDDA